MGSVAGSGVLLNKMLGKQAEKKIAEATEKSEKADRELNDKMVKFDERIKDVIKDSGERTKIGRVRTLTVVFTAESGSNIERFRGIKITGKEKDFQNNSDVIYIHTMAHYTFKYAQELKKTFRRREEKLKVRFDAEDAKVLTRDKIRVIDALNNYVYYASAIQIENKSSIWAALHEYEILVKEMKLDGDKNSYRYVDTMIWARLHLGDLTGEEAKEKLETLFEEVSKNEYDPDGKWEHGIRKQIKMHDKRFKGNKVGLSI